MLLGNKTADEIEAFGGSQEAWGIFFFLIWRTSAGKTNVFSTIWIFLCALFVHRPWESLGMLQDLLWRWFLGFSVSPTGIWSLGANMDGHNACPLCAWHRTWRLDSSSTTLWCAWCVWSSCVGRTAMLRIACQTTQGLIWAKCHALGYKGYIRIHRFWGCVIVFLQASQRPSIKNPLALNGNPSNVWALKAPSKTLSHIILMPKRKNTLRTRLDISMLCVYPTRF
jgi:hypothetical protein